MLAMNEALMVGSVRQHEVDRSGRISNVLLQQEIAERKRVEAALRESEKRYRSLVRVGPRGLLFLRWGGRD